MKRNLTAKETITITSMLFGMFFGAGNLIFPVMVGIQAGSNLWSAFCGIFMTAVGLPMLAVVALGLSRCEGVLALSEKVGRKYGLFFSTLLYLTIGPLFAIPRCASTAFSVGAVNLIPSEHHSVYLALFSGAFFLVVLAFSWKPNGIMTWIGKFLNPIFLISLGILIITALLNPVAPLSTLPPSGDYAQNGAAFFKGFLEGYNTLDALAGLAFGIVVVNVVRKQGIEAPDRIAANTARAGIFSCLLMGLIYLCITLTAAQSAPICAGAADGGAVLGLMAEHYFHTVGAVLTAAIVTFACLKTAVGLVTSCSEAFLQMFPKGPGYRVWAVLCAAVSFAAANFGLSTIVAWCIPVLMFLYPLAMTLILLALGARFFGDSQKVYAWTIGFTLAAAVIDFLNALQSLLPAPSALIASIVGAASRVLPLFSLGLGWILPAVIGFGIGMAMREKKR